MRKLLFILTITLLGCEIRETKKVVHPPKKSKAKKSKEPKEKSEEKEEPKEKEEK